MAQLPRLPQDGIHHEGRVQRPVPRDPPVVLFAGSADHPVERHLLYALQHQLQRLVHQRNLPLLSYPALIAMFFRKQHVHHLLPVLRPPPLQKARLRRRKVRPPLRSAQTPYQLQRRDRAPHSSPDRLVSGVGHEGFFK